MSAFSCDVSVEDFEHKVIEPSRRVPVLVDFWAPWCAPCRALKPILEKLADEYQGRFLLAKLNSDENPALSARYGVRSIPAVKAFVNGELVDEFLGALPEGRVREFIDSLVPSLAEPLRREADAARGRGEPEAARRLLEQAVALDPKHEAARLDLAGLLIDDGRFEQANTLLDQAGDRARDGARVSALRARLGLLQNAPPASDAAHWETRLAANADDNEARLALANLLAARQDYAGALAHLMQLVRRERRSADDAGRRTMIQIFDLLGSDHDLVRRYRRELAAALN
ncbi:MAG: tetratricopeptide repeat protein [Sterolibacteriaceae bacterium]|nr:tetratricopeptide repeat protein [Candidatus Methylophosphatis haderslevensis]